MKERTATASWTRLVKYEAQMHRAASVPPDSRATSKVWNDLERNLPEVAKKRWPGKRCRLDRTSGVIYIK